MMIFLFLITLIVALTAFGAIYQFSLALVYFAVCRKHGKQAPPRNHFTLLIPAHNESVGLCPVLSGLSSLEYPKELFRIVVVADNCTDDTAKIARECGVDCLERFDTEKRGKGAALSWSIPKLLEPYEEQGKTVQTDAIMVIDADCFLDSHTLIVSNTALEKGAKAVQIPSLATNPDVSFGCYAMSLARVTEYLLYYWPKSRLGLSAALLGTGMVLHREVLEKYPWNCEGLTEDVEYNFLLLKNGVFPVFAGEAGLASPFPVDSKTLAVQRSRWIFGGFETLKNSILSFIRLGIVKRDIRLFDAGLSAIYISRPIVLAQVALSCLLSLSAVLLIPSTWSWILLLMCGLTILLYMLYIVFGVCVLGLNRKRWGYLLFLPVFIFNYLTITIKSLLFWRPKTWERTPRE